MRRKGEVRVSTRLRQYPYVASMQLDYRRTLAEQEAVSAAASSISGGDYLTSSSFRVESGMAWHFRTSAEAHAMQVWLEGHVRPYDAWEERRRSNEATQRWRREVADFINAAAVTGALQRIRQLHRERDRIELLRELEPRLDVEQARRAVTWMASGL